MAKTDNRAGELRNNMGAAEYKHVILGLICVKDISDAFEEKRAALEADKKAAADAEDPDEYRADRLAQGPGLFFVFATLRDDGSIYFGQTEDLQRGWIEHQRGKASEHTRQHKSVKLAHFQESSSRKEAIDQEKRLKTGFGWQWLRREIEAGRARQAGGTIRYDPVGVIDSDDPGQNDWLVVNQCSIAEGGRTKQSDVVVFVKSHALPSRR